MYLPLPGESTRYEMRICVCVTLSEQYAKEHFCRCCGFFIIKQLNYNFNIKLYKCVDISH